MPFVSKAQRRKFYAMKNRGEISDETIKHWEELTPKDLPERVKKAGLMSDAGDWMGKHPVLTTGAGVGLGALGAVGAYKGVGALRRSLTAGPLTKKVRDLASKGQFGVAGKVQGSSQIGAARRGKPWIEEGTETGKLNFIPVDEYGTVVKKNPKLKMTMGVLDENSKLPDVAMSGHSNRSRAGRKMVNQMEVVRRGGKLHEVKNMGIEDLFMPTSSIHDIA
jgi:hypothetical protein